MEPEETEQALGMGMVVVLVAQAHKARPMQTVMEKAETQHQAQVIILRVVVGAAQIFQAQQKLPVLAA